MSSLNLPNQLTLGRLVMCAVFVACMSWHWPYGFTTALVIFLLASLTDWLDGQIARRQNLVTDLGKLLDPLADKVLISAALISLVERGFFPMWMAVAIVAREFLITGLRMLGATKHMVLAAERVGKHKTVTQIVAISGALLYLSLGEFSLGESMMASWLRVLLPVLNWLALIVTVVSGALYFYKNRTLVLDEAATAARPNRPPAAPLPPGGRAPAGVSSSVNLGD